MSATARKQGPISRSQSQALTREALLDAAEILILEQSIPGMSLRAVCTQAGFSQGASYSNFANREELLLAVMERNLEQKARSLEEMLSNCRNGDIDETLEAVVGWLDTISHRSTWARMAIELRLHATRDALFARKLEAAQTRVDQRFGSHIGGLVDRFGLTPRLPPEQIALALLMLWRGMALQASSAHPSARTAGDGLPVVFAVCLRGLLGVPQ